MAAGIGTKQRWTEAGLAACRALSDSQWALGDWAAEQVPFHVSDARAAERVNPLVIKKTLDGPAWIAAGRAAFARESESLWALGDWAAGIPDHLADSVIESVWAGDADQIHSCRETALIFPAHRRRGELSFKGHAMVADLHAAVADDLLERAAGADWSLERLFAVAELARCRLQYTRAAQELELCLNSRESSK